MLLDGSSQQSILPAWWAASAEFAAEMGGWTCTHIPTTQEKNKIYDQLAALGLGRDPCLET
jgi:hypothetical protein